MATHTISAQSYLSTTDDICWITPWHHRRYLSKNTLTPQMISAQEHLNTKGDICPRTPWHHRWYLPKNTLTLQFLVVYKSIKKQTEKKHENTFSREMEVNLWTQSNDQWTHGSLSLDYCSSFRGGNVRL